MINIFFYMTWLFLLQWTVREVLHHHHQHHRRLHHKLERAYCRFCKTILALLAFDSFKYVRLFCFFSFFEIVFCDFILLKFAVGAIVIYWHEIFRCVCLAGTKTLFFHTSKSKNDRMNRMKLVLGRPVRRFFTLRDLATSHRRCTLLILFVRSFG